MTNPRLVDRDFRHDGSINTLVKKGIAVLRVSAVESLYYSPISFEAVARKKFDKEAEDKIKQVKESILECLENNEDVAEEMAARRSEKLLVNDFDPDRIDNLIGWKNIKDNGNPNIKISLENPYLGELAQFKELVEKQKLDELFDRYPLHQIQMQGADIPRKIANNLGFKKRSEYEEMLIALIQDDQDLALKLKRRIEMPQAMRDA